MMVPIYKCPRVTVVLLIIFIALSFIACGDSDEDSKDKESPTDNAKLNGIWAGSYGNDATDIILLLNNGEIYAVDDDSAYAGTYSYSTAADKFTVNAQNANTVIELNGTATEQRQIEATYTSSAGKTGNLTLDFRDTLFNRASSFELLSGEWASERSNYSIDDEGHLTGTYVGDCQISGTFSIIYPEQNLYALDADITQCETEGQYNGLAYLYVSGTDQYGGLLAVIVNEQTKHSPLVWGERQ
jgi:hypothetical protein